MSREKREKFIKINEKIIANCDVIINMENRMLELIYQVCSEPKIRRQKLRRWQKQLRIFIHNKRDAIKELENVNNEII